jgi:hypothetical protein
VWANAPFTRRFTDTAPLLRRDRLENLLLEMEPMAGFGVAPPGNPFVQQLRKIVIFWLREHF